MLHTSRSDPIAYRAASLEDMSKTIYQQKKRIHAAEVDAEQSKKALVSTENQVGPSADTKEGAQAERSVRSLGFRKTLVQNSQR
jgi:hypothetical protein